MIEYYVGRGNNKFGPYDESQTKSMFVEGRISPQDLLWRSGFADWLSAESVLAAPQLGQAAMPMSMPIPMPAPTSAPAPAPAPAVVSPTSPAAVDQIGLSPKWKRRFALIEKAGGAKMPAFKTLTFGERFACFNWLAFFFGLCSKEQAAGLLPLAALWLLLPGLSGGVGLRRAAGWLAPHLLASPAPSPLLWVASSYSSGHR